MSSSVHVEVLKPTPGLNDTTLTVEAKYPIKLLSYYT